MPSAAGLAFAALSLLFAWLLWSGRGEEGTDSRWRLRLRSAIPPLMIAACLPSGCSNERFDTVRLSAGGMAVTEVALQGGRAGAAAVAGCEPYLGGGGNPIFVVGRQRGCVDLVVQDPSATTPDGAMIRLDQNGDAAAIRLASLAANGDAMIAAIDLPEGRKYIGAVPIAEGDRLCLARCGADGKWFTFSGGALTPEGGAARTLRVRPGLFGWLQPYGPQTRINRLGALMCDTPNEAGTCAEPARNEAGQTATSFLFQQGGFRGAAWSVLLLDPGAQLRRANGEVVTARPTEDIALAAGERRHVALLGLREGLLRELRSFTLGHSFAGQPSPERRFTLDLDTPEMIPIGTCDRPLSRLTLAPEQSSPEALSLRDFGSRPQSVLTSAAAGFPIGRYDLCRSTTFDFMAPATPTGQAAQNEPVRRQIAFSVDRMAIPWLLLALAGAIAFIVHAVSEPVWLRRRLDGQILAIAQYLLCVRAIIGVEGVFDDPALDWRNLYLDIGVAMLTLPMILLAVRKRGGGLTAIASLLLFLGLSVAALWLWLGAPDRISILFIGLAGLALLARGFYLWRGDRTDAPARFSLTALVTRSPGFWPWLLAAIVIARVLLGLVGFRERIFGIALSAVYVPLLLIGIAAILAKAEGDESRRFRFGLYFLGALAVAVGGVSLAINDVGFALVHVPPIAGIAIWRLRLWRQESEEKPKLLQIAPWATPAIGLVTLYFAIWGWVALTPPPSDQAPLAERVAYAVDDNQRDANLLRLRAVFAPGQIDRIGNRNAAEQLDQSLLLGDLTGTLFGRGWITPLDLGSFQRQAVHLSDYLSATHIMEPFGRVGALCLILVLAAGAGAAVSGRVKAPADWPSLAGTLAIWTLFGAAAYMVLANLLLVPFTGRNIYLLAASSGGDLVEGLALLLLARIGLAERRST